MLVSVLALVATPVGASASDAACPHADSLPSAASADDLAAATLCLVNAERAAQGQKPLAANPVLGQTARAYASEMVATEHFAHADASGGHVPDRVLAVGGSLDPWLELGENLGWGSNDAATPRLVVEGWMQSPTHRDNILYAPFNRLGVGIADGVPTAEHPQGQTYVAVFGQQRQARKPKRCSRTRSKSRSATRKARACRARTRR